MIETSVIFHDLCSCESHAKEVTPLKNFVDKDVQKMLKPLNLMQSVSLCPKYKIKDDYITPNSRVSSFLSLCGTISYVSVFIYRCVMLYLAEHDPRALYMSSFYDSAYNCIGFIMNFLLSIMYSDSNIMFILIVQDVHKFLNHESSFRRLIFGNWLFACFSFTFFTVFFTFFQFSLQMPWYYFSTCILAMFDLHVIYAIRLIRLLEIKVYLWQIQALSAHELENADPKEYNQKMFKTFSKILKCYELYKVCHRYPVSTEAVYLLEYFFTVLFIHGITS